MAKLLLNAGSTSLKYQLFADDGVVLKKGGSSRVKNFQLAFADIIAELKFSDEITVIGHRVVHGGEYYCQPTIINEEVISRLASIVSLAPLHLPFNLLGMHLAIEHWPSLPQVAVFDTAFFADLPVVAKTYALPEQLASKKQWYRYGFHGLSHEYLTQAAAEELNKKLDQVNLIICHLGGGSSVSAVQSGKAIDISLGWSPTAGLPMMTRCGDLDPGLLLAIIEELPGPIDEQKINQVRELLNKQSGLFGLCGYDDFLDILAARNRGEIKAITAFDYFSYRLLNYIGAYWAVLGGQVDAIILSGAIGAGSLDLRQTVADKLTGWCSAPLLAISTNEELAMFKEIKKLGL
jgi:acetate kinase